MVQFSFVFFLIDLNFKFTDDITGENQNKINDFCSAKKNNISLNDSADEINNQIKRKQIFKKISR